MKRTFTTPIKNLDMTKKLILFCLLFENKQNGYYCG